MRQLECAPRERSTLQGSKEEGVLVLLTVVVVLVAAAAGVGGCASPSGYCYKAALVQFQKLLRNILQLAATILQCQASISS